MKNGDRTKMKVIQLLRRRQPQKRGIGYPADTKLKTHDAKSPPHVLTSATQGGSRNCTGKNIAEKSCLRSARWRVPSGG